MKFDRIMNAIAALGVIVSLLFLGYETKKNTQMVRATSNDVLNNTNIEFLRMLTENDDLGQLFIEATISWDNLNRDEKRKANFILVQYFRQNENMYFQNKIGVFDDQLWDSHKHIVLSYFAKPGVQEWWAIRKNNFSQDFRSFLEQSLMQ